MTVARNYLFKANGTVVASLVATVCFVIGLSVTAHVSALLQKELISQHKREAVAGLSEIRARLEGEVSRTVAHGFGIRSYVTQFVDQPFQEQDYSEISMELVEENPSIRSVSLAPNNILRAVYPFEPNKAAIGLNYRLNSAQWPAVKEAMTTREVVIAGPLDLVQGGTALLVHIPVFPATFHRQPIDERSYWGVATLALDQQSLISSAGIKDVVNGVRIGIVNNNTVDANRMIVGSAALLDKDHVSLPLNLLGGLDWDLIGYPEASWSTHGDQVWFSQVLGGLVSLIFGAMAFLLVNEIFKVRSMALHDPLTGLANRRLLEERMYQLAALCERTGSGFEIFYADLDAFKPVNDTFGHAVGDKLLIEVSKRLRSQTRQTDTVARVGGDEFIVLVPGNMRSDEKQQFQARLEKKVTESFASSGKPISVQASIGAATYPTDARSIEELLKVADNRMYAQKSKNKAKAGTASTEELTQLG